MTKKSIGPDSSLEMHYDSILGDIANVIDAARGWVARSVNSIMTAAYWLIGRRIVEFEQGGKVRAQYGASLLERLSSDLANRYGKGFGVDNLQRFRALYLVYPPERIYATRQERYELGNDINSKVLAFAFGLSAEIERNLISQRTVEAFARKKKEGKKLGRPKSSLAKVTKLTGRENEIKLLLEKKVSVSAIARILGVNRLTVRHFIRTRELK